MSISAALLLAIPLFARKEDRLVDKLIHAQRAVERANAKSEAAGKKLTDYCKTQGKIVRVKRNGVIGCVEGPK